MQEERTVFLDKDWNKDKYSLRSVTHNSLSYQNVLLFLDKYLLCFSSHPRMIPKIKIFEKKFILLFLVAAIVQKHVLLPKCKQQTEKMSTLANQKLCTWPNLLRWSETNWLWLTSWSWSWVKKVKPKKRTENYGLKEKQQR